MKPRSKRHLPLLVFALFLTLLLVLFVVPAVQQARLIRHVESKKGSVGTMAPTWMPLSFSSFAERHFGQVMDGLVDVETLTFAPTANDVGRLHRIAADLEYLEIEGVQLDPKDWQRFPPMPALEQLWMDYVNIDDQSLDLLLQGMPNLRTLSAAEVGISDQVIPLLPPLDYLGINRTAITSEGLVQLQAEDLRFLNIRNTPVDDSAVVWLSGLTNLAHLLTSGSEITSDGRTALKQALPGLKDFD